MKLISMTDFVIEKEFGYGNEVISSEQFTKLICNYVNFLKQPLEIWMFVPCKLVNGVWVVLVEKPLSPKTDENWNKWIEYQQAKDRVLFKGFTFQEYRNCPTVKNGKLTFIFDEHGCWLEAYDSCDGQRIDNIERLTQLNLSEEHLQLTRTAIKIIG